MFNFRINSYLNIQKHLLDMNKVLQSRIKNKWDENHLHFLLLNYLKFFSNYTGFTLSIYTRHRDANTAFENVDEVKGDTLGINKTLDELFGKNVLTVFTKNDKTGRSLFQLTGRKDIGTGILFNLFQRYDYVVFNKSVNKTSLRFFEILEITLYDLLIRIETGKRYHRYRQTLKITKEELNQKEQELNLLQKTIKKRTYEINNLLEISNKIYSILKLDHLMSSALLILVGQIGCQKAFALLYDETESKYSKLYTKGLADDSNAGFALDPDSPIINHLKQNRKTIETEKLVKHARIKDDISRLRNEDIEILAPVFFNQEMIGIIGIGNKLYDSDWNEYDIQIVNILINIISVSIGNAKLYEDTIQLSLTDGMTKLYNYRYFDERLKEEMSRAERSQQPLTMMMLDIDYFKNYNDSLGHQAGDDAIRTVAWLIKHNVRESDVVFRYGGEEFCILLPGMPRDSVYVLAERIRKQIMNQPFYKEEVQPKGKLTISIGSATYPDDSAHEKELVEKADAALYKSKERGRNKFTLYEQHMSDTVKNTSV
ncbi:MAG: diguanylate cyclase [Caldithrix sp.]|nr:diguanylate cyclase [Caldithrix sp.]